MEIFKKTPNIDFAGQTRWAVGLSAAVIGGMLLFMLVSEIRTGNALTYGIDFAGGFELQVKFDQTTTATEVRDALEPTGIDATVTTFGDEADNEFLLRVMRTSNLSTEQLEKAREALVSAVGAEQVKRFEFDEESGTRVDLELASALDEARMREIFGQAGISISAVEKSAHEVKAEYVLHLEGVAQRVEGALKTALGAKGPRLLKVEFVGPQVGAKLRTQGIMALIYSMFFMLIYVAIRFDIFFAPGAIIALVHDVIVTVGGIALLGIEFNLTMIAVLLTIIGYSINDTIVIYDRVRENALRHKGMDPATLVNLSVNETLSRTILTSSTVMMTTLFLAVFGAGVIRDFAIAMMVGLVSGTWSTVYIASALYVALRKRFAKEPAAA
jgi:preprotein translocase subunit SecF